MSDALLPAMADAAAGFSIVIPTWNNLPYLKLCVASLRRHSAYPHELLVHVNAGTDGTLAYVQDEKLQFTHTPTNVGVCRAVNQAAALATRRYLAYFNDDMVALPGWDSELVEFARQQRLPEASWLSATLIEGYGRHPLFLADGPRYNYGRTAAQFDEARLLRDLPRLRTLKGDVQGSTAAPNLMPRALFARVGGFSVAYSPGAGSDPDLAKKVYDAGCRHFLGVGRSLIYHFGSVVMGRVRRNDGAGTFRRQYGLSIEQFVHEVLHRGTPWPPPARPATAEDAR